MNILLSRIQGQVNSTDRTRSLVIGISAGLTALWSLYRVFWLFYATSVLSGVGLSSATLLFSTLLWGGVGIAAAVVSAVFLIRYAKHA